MEKPVVSMIAALQKKDRAIGKGNNLLWRISDDLKRFKSLTTGHPIIMGRKTFESIGRPLPNRTNIIITRNSDYIQENCIICHSVSEAIEYAQKNNDSEIFIIGGGEIYKEALPHANKLYLTVVDDTQTGDVFFPDYSEFKKVISEENHSESVPSY